jgi:flagellar FliJ protein
VSGRPGKVHEADRGMHAVARVREVREHDSRVGLQQALAEETARERRVVELHRHVEHAPAFEAGSAASFLALRQSLASLGQAVTEARGELESSRRITESARAYWQRDKSRLSAVEALLESRAETRRAEAARAETARLDEAAGQLWLRARNDDHRTGSAR